MREWDSLAGGVHKLIGHQVVNNNGKNRAENKGQIFVWFDMASIETDDDWSGMGVAP